jgi:hypothetical protein
MWQAMRLPYNPIAGIVVGQPLQLPNLNAPVRNSQRRLKQTPYKYPV